MVSSLSLAGAGRTARPMSFYARFPCKTTSIAINRVKTIKIIWHAFCIGSVDYRLVADVA
jgi:hypothetical protein